MSAETFHALLSQANPHAVALVFQGAAITYGQLRREVGRVAQVLDQAGVGPGDVVGVWLPNHPRWLIGHLACGLLGAATLSLNLKLALKEVQDFASRAGARALLFDRAVLASKAEAEAVLEEGDDCWHVLQQLQSRIGDPLTVFCDASVDSGSASYVTANALPPALQGRVLAWPQEGAAAEQPEPPWGGPARAVDDREPGLIVSSSGTTSQPKLIVHTQRNICRHIADVSVGFGITSSSRVLLSLPVCGAFGYISAMVTLAAGATLVLQEGFDAALTAQTLAAEPITHFFGTNDMMQKVLDSVDAQWRPHSLQFMGHANFVPGLDDVPARAMAQGVRMVGCFGMSEIFALFAHQDLQADLPRRAQAGGIPITPGVQVRARVLETGQVAAPMQEGELEIRGPYMMQGYLGNAEATQQAFTEDGFLRTGDLGYVNGDGGFTHIARLGDVLRIGGFLVNPAEIEEAVMAVCPVAACQVVAVNSAGGSRPVAFVLEREGQHVHEAQVQQLLMQQIAKYKVPIRILAVPDFPYVVGPNGKKVKKSALRELAQHHIDNKERI